MLSVRRLPRSMSRAAAMASLPSRSLFSSDGRSTQSSKLMRRRDSSPLRSSSFIADGSGSFDLVFLLGGAGLAAFLCAVLAVRWLGGGIFGADACARGWACWARCPPLFGFFEKSQICSFETISSASSLPWMFSVSLSWTAVSPPPARPIIESRSTSRATKSDLASTTIPPFPGWRTRSDVEDAVVETPRRAVRGISIGCRPWNAEHEARVSETAAESLTAPPSFLLAVGRRPVGLLLTCVSLIMPFPSLTCVSVIIRFLRRA
mmetsp:Transcript_29312/g.69777  ORF Transcript_29312/g.69777 Transcript_29312/m.69777 type:complete len:263 (+) Transcript_29312:1520-2308(+)